MKRPVMRFKEFKDDWMKYSLNNFAEKITKKNNKFEVKNVISNSSQYGLVSQRDYFDKDIANAENIDNYYVIDDGDFVYNPRISKESPYGPVNIYKYPEPGVVSPLYLCFRVEGVSKTFLSYFFKTSYWYRHIYLNGDSGARHDRVSIKDSDFLSMEVHLPSLQEQEKVSSFLSLFDKKIEKQQEKIERLELFKKGIIQKIFTQEIRFEGFTQPWEIKRLDELCSINPKSSKIPERFLYIDLESVEKGRICKKLEVVEKESAPSRAQRLLQVGDILYQMVRPYQMNNFQFIEEGSIPTVASTGYAQLRSKKSSGFLYQLIHAPFFVKEVLLRCTGSSYPAINTSDLSEIEVEVPVDIEEQMKIANFLSTIDKKINYEVEKLVLLENYKKGFLENMFV